jgi:hypothetical protein
MGGRGHAPAGELRLGRVGGGEPAGLGGDADGAVEALAPAGDAEGEEAHRYLAGDPEAGGQHAPARWLADAWVRLLLDPG